MHCETDVLCVTYAENMSADATCAVSRLSPQEQTPLRYIQISTQRNSFSGSTQDHSGFGDPLLADSGSCSSALVCPHNRTGLLQCTSRERPFQHVQFAWGHAESAISKSDWCRKSALVFKNTDVRLDGCFETVFADRLACVDAFCPPLCELVTLVSRL